MEANPFHTGLVAATRRAMEANWRGHQETVHNLNNYDTPGFRPQHTDFRAVLEGLSQDNPKGAAFQAYLEDVTPRAEMNVDRELAQLAEGSMTADALTRILNKQYSGLRQAIFEGKR